MRRLALSWCAGVEPSLVTSMTMRSASRSSSSMSSTAACTRALRPSIRADNSSDMVTPAEATSALLLEAHSEECHNSQTLTNQYAPQPSQRMCARQASGSESTTTTILATLRSTEL